MLFFISCKRNQNSTTENSLWSVDPINSGVDGDLRVLKNEFRIEYDEMEKHLQSTPGIGIPGKYSQMRLDTRVWEYKLPYDNRVLLILDFEQRMVRIGYAGQHLNKRCTDRQIRRIGKKY